MKVAILTAPRTLAIVEQPMPVPGPGEVLVKVGAVGVCGSDTHYYMDGRIGAVVATYPAVLGHEPSGVIHQTGPGAKLSPGTRVMVEPAASCGECEPCRSGKPHICPRVRFLGSPPVDGIFAQYRVMPEACCVPVPDGMSLRAAAMLEPLGVGLHAVRLARVSLGDTVAVFGAGGIGIATGMAARAAGAARLFMTDLVPERLKAAERLCGAETFNPKDGDPIEWLSDRTGGRLVDVTMEAAGRQETFTHACLGAAQGGRMVAIGIPAEDRMELPIHEIRRKELEMIQDRRSNNEAVAAIPLVMDGRLPAGELATHFFPLERIEEAFRVAIEKSDGAIRVVVEPNDDLAGK